MLRPGCLTVDPKVHAGTQTFIQALQAVPWAEDQDNDDDVMNHDISPADTESDDEDKTGASMTVYTAICTHRLPS